MVDLKAIQSEFEQAGEKAENWVGSTEVRSVLFEVDVTAAVLVL